MRSTNITQIICTYTLYVQAKNHWQFKTDERKWMDRFFNLSNGKSFEMTTESTVINAPWPEWNKNPFRAILVAYGFCVILGFGHKETRWENILYSIVG